MIGKFTEVGVQKKIEVERPLEASLRDIELKFDKEELALLVKLTYIGYFVIDEEVGPKSGKTEAIVEQLLQTANTYDVMDGIEYDREAGTYDFDAEAEEAVLEEYNEFIETSFWEELVSRMARIEFLKSIGEKRFLELTVEERIKQEDKFMRKYQEEFANNGLKNLTLKK